MKCAEVQRVLPELVESAQEGEFGAHLRECPACSELVSDLQLISSAARQLAAADEPAPRVWVRIAADLKAEGLIREPEAVPASPVPVPTPRRRWSAWWLVPVAAALVAGASYFVRYQPAPQVAQQVQPVPAPAVPAPASHAPATVAQAPATKVSPQQKTNPRTEVAEVPSLEDQQFLSEVSTRDPGMRVTFENQLRAVNAYIREVQAYLDRNPGDEDARQHLMEAYRQKAMLYQMALEHVQ